jgi:hypothetical protein
VNASEESAALRQYLLRKRSAYLTNSHGSAAGVATRPAVGAKAVKRFNSHPGSMNFCPYHSAAVRAADDGQSRGTGVDGRHSTER